MANSAKRRRGRSRKRRPEDAAAVTQGGGDAALSRTPDGARAEPLKVSGAASSQRATQPKSSSKTAKAPPPTSTLGERPHAPWHPLPLSEILILVGALATVIGLRGDNHVLLVAGLVAAGLGTIEVTVREHWSGYRSHATLLAVAVVLVFHSAIVLGASAFAQPTQLLNFVLLPIDFALFVFLFRVLRARFLEARHRRALGLP